MNVTVDGLHINYTVQGEGPAVVLLHGWGANLQSFRMVQVFLSPNFRTYAIDLPGFGESDEPPVAWGVPEYTDFLHKWLTALNIENPILVGHSNGGRISIMYASSRPVRKIILIDSAGIKPRRKLGYYVRVYTYKAAKNLLKLPGLRPYSDDLLGKFKAKLGSTDYKSVSGIMQQTMVKVVNIDLRHLLPMIKAPTLLVWGENDTATPVSDGQLMEKLIPDAGLVVLKNAGHFSYIDKAQQFLIIIDNFLKNDKGGRPQS